MFIFSTPHQVADQHLLGTKKALNIITGYAFKQAAVRSNDNR